MRRAVSLMFNDKRLEISGCDRQAFHRFLSELSVHPQMTQWSITFNSGNIDLLALVNAIFPDTPNRLVNIVLFTNTIAKRFFYRNKYIGACILNVLYLGWSFLVPVISDSVCAM